ncbi:UNVERIFIED_ORG: hypothetical protein M2328_005726 [Rhodococcus erythropolis]
MSEPLSVQETITAIMREVSHVGKDGRNTSQNFNFRGVDAVVNALAAPIREHGLVIAPVVKRADHREITSGNGKRQAWVIVEVAYEFIGPKGDRIDAVVVAEATDFADKATAKAMSVAYRTVLLQVFNLPTDEPDPDSDYVERGGEPAARPASKPAAKSSPDDAVASDLRAQIVAKAKDAQLQPSDVTALVVEAGGKGPLNSQKDPVVLRSVLALIPPF